MSVIEAPVSDSAAIDRAAPAARSQLRYETAVVLVRTAKRVLRRRVMALRIIDKLSNWATPLVKGRSTVRTR